MHKLSDFNEQLSWTKPQFIDVACLNNSNSLTNINIWTFVNDLYTLALKYVSHKEDLTSDNYAIKLAEELLKKNDSFFWNKRTNIKINWKNVKAKDPNDISNVVSYSIGSISRLTSRDSSEWKKAWNKMLNDIWKNCLQDNISLVSLILKSKNKKQIKNALIELKCKIVSHWVFNKVDEIIDEYY